MPPWIKEKKLCLIFYTGSAGRLTAFGIILDVATLVRHWTFKRDLSVFFFLFFEHSYRYYCVYGECRKHSCNRWKIIGTSVNSFNLVNQKFVPSNLAELVLKRKVSTFTTLISFLSRVFTSFLRENKDLFSWKFCKYELSLWTVKNSFFHN